MTTQSIINLDARFTITPEFCGHPTAQYVVRFCGKYIACFAARSEAIKGAQAYADKRNEELESV